MNSFPWHLRRELDFWLLMSPKSVFERSLKNKRKDIEKSGSISEEVLKRRGFPPDKKRSGMAGREEVEGCGAGRPVNTTGEAFQQLKRTVGPDQWDRNLSNLAGALPADPAPRGHHVVHSWFLTAESSV